MDVAVDTSFLLECVRRHVDLRTELYRIVEGRWSVVVLPEVQKELREKKEGRGVALLLGACRAIYLPEHDSERGADAALAAYSVETGSTVATQDGRLKEKLKKQGVAVVTVRKKGVLALIGA